MKILFTKSEYRTLVDMIYLADWMLTAHDEVDDPAKAQYEHLVQKIYSHAKEMDCGDLIDGSAADNQYFPTRDYEEKSGIRTRIDEYDAENFWNQLVDRLTERDIEAKLGAKGLERLSPDEYWAATEPIADVYEREVSVHGIDRLHIKKSGPGN